LSVFPQWSPKTGARTGAMFISSPIGDFINALPAIVDESKLSIAQIQQYDFQRQKWIHHQLQTTLKPVSDMPLASAKPRL